MITIHLNAVPIKSRPIIVGENRNQAEDSERLRRDRNTGDSTIWLYGPQPQLRGDVSSEGSHFAEVYGLATLVPC